jgi:endogenous inhibitor of DNA gyrase (YacG/DUF329 family)|tara:strand:+ start:307 stop:492 length:186 start_codon:yes stop_codon:yes gene_type:complete
MEIAKENNNKVVKFNKNRSKCPTCKKKTIEKYNPFCSKKCSDIDLSKWLSDENTIETNFEQ